MKRFNDVVLEPAPFPRDLPIIRAQPASLRDGDLRSVVDGVALAAFAVLYLLCTGVIVLCMVKGAPPLLLLAALPGGIVLVWFGVAHARLLSEEKQAKENRLAVRIESESNPLRVV